MSKAKQIKKAKHKKEILTLTSTVFPPGSICLSRYSEDSRSLQEEEKENHKPRTCVLALPLSKDWLNIYIWKGQNLQDTFPKMFIKITETATSNGATHCMGYIDF